MSNPVTIANTVTLKYARAARHISGIVGAVTKVDTMHYGPGLVMDWYWFTDEAGSVDAGWYSSATVRLI